MSAAGPDLFDAPDAAGTPPPPASAEEKLARLRLARAAGVGPAQFLALLARFGAAEAALEALPSLPAGGRRRAAPISRAAAEDELAAGAALGARLLHLGAPDYPARLAAIADPPPVLWVLGPADPGAGRAVAVIGARNASSLGLRMARTLAADLGDAGYVIASG
ncbi:MAG: DNA-processing protein DprA, partial [Pseudomonadota bacterium]